MRPNPNGAPGKPAALPASHLPGGPEAPLPPAERRALGQALVRWFARHRRPLPWREAYAPYQVWISEMMLQQTQVATVLPYYQRWMARFPSLADVARAPQEEVLKAWEGLGYYARARSLHQAAGEMMERHGGAVPDEVEALSALPGIGPYTAAAIAAIAFNRPEVAVDGNAARVLSRIFARLAGATPATGRAELAAMAAALLPPGGARDFNQALMELGALVCRAAKTRCGECPARPHCRAAAMGRPLDFPGKRPRPTRPLVSGAMLLLSRRGRLLVRRRPPEGLWGGLWEFPWLEEKTGATGKQTVTRLGKTLGAAFRAKPRELGTVRHGLTHFQLELACFAAEGTANGETPGENMRETRWVSRRALGELPLGKPNHKAMALWAAPEPGKAEKRPKKGPGAARKTRAGRRAAGAGGRK